MQILRKAPSLEPSLRALYEVSREPADITLLEISGVLDSDIAHNEFCYKHN